MQLTFGSLFAGIGGFDLGFERAGFECRWQVEIDNYATKILEKHWPKVHRQTDIRECNSSNLERVDCIIGGFPCQDISYAGRGAGLDGERSGLFFEAIRLVSELQPRAIVLENVAALLTRGLDRVLGTLAEIGYDAEWHCIPAAAVGAPHIRDRVFILAYANESCESKEWIQRRGEQLRISGNHGEDQKRISPNTQSDGRKKGKPNSRRGTKGIRSRQEHRSRGLCEDVADARCKLRQSWSVSESSGDKATDRIKEASDDQRRSSNTTDPQGLYAQGLHNGLRESEFWGSKWWEFEPAVGRVANGIPARVDRLRCLGNAIVPQVAEVVARMALESLDRMIDRALAKQRNAKEGAAS